MTIHHSYVASTPAALSVAEAIAHDWEYLDIRGHFLARNIDTDEELGFDVGVPVPLASVIKVPLALVVLEAIARGEIDPAAAIGVDPARSVGSTGVSAFRFPATIAVADLVLMMLSVSDNASADVLIELVGGDAINDAVRAWGCAGIRFRHPMQLMHDSAHRAAAGKVSLALELAIQSDQTGRHTIEPLDPGHANVGTAADLVALLQRVWRDEISERGATAELRRLMGMQMFTHRLASDLRSDTLRVSGKTGSYLHLRHEIGVVESVAPDPNGARVAIAALTRTGRPAAIAADVDLAIGDAARTAFEELRGSTAVARRTGPVHVSG
jgi:beta-lactamase class A